MKPGTTIIVVAVCAVVCFLAWKLIPAATTVTVPPTYPGITRGLGIGQSLGLL